ncbi:hypothetical protein S21ZY_093 [Pseudomonas phage ZY21]|nr:hypothetical protein S21ZY_093 [Pseudomonas phage ZY21]
MIEIAANTGIGFVGSWLIARACVHYVNDPVALTTSITVICTVWSLLRGYFLRRYFNNRKAS